MTAQQALSTWPAIKAFGEGRKIQWKYANTKQSWSDVATIDPEFESSAYEWREKPAPRQVWVRFSDNGVLIGATEASEPKPTPGTELVRFTEDIRP